MTGLSRIVRGVVALTMSAAAVQANAQGAPDPQAALAAAEARADASRLQAEADRRAVLIARVAAGKAAEMELGRGPAAPLAAAAPPPVVQAVQPAKGAGDPVASSVDDLAEALAAKEEERAKANFGGIEFGVGISFTLDVGTSDRVTNASVVDGVIRVDDEDNGRARIMLESHYFFTSKGRTFLGVQPGDWGAGPFVALQPGTDDIIEAIALGGMIGFRRPNGGSESFNLGLGVVIDPNTRILGEGLVANQPLPGGETEIRYKQEMQTGLLVLASFGF
jgi:hypothetical protein